MSQRERRVAVVTRTKDRPVLLSRARESVESQTFKDLIWIVVNDAGERDAVDWEAGIARTNRIETLVVHRDTSIGMEAASNDGIGRARTEYVVVHDDDDSWQPDFLARTVAFLDANPGHVAVTTQCYRIDETLADDRPRIFHRSPYNGWLTAVQIGDIAMVNRFPPISFLFRRSLYEEIGGFDESLPVLGDWDFVLRTLVAGDIGVIPELLANYHFRPRLPKELKSYGNSLTESVDQHARFDALYRNKKLREDIAKGRPGLGFLLAQGRMQQHTVNRLDGLNQVIAKFKTLADRLRILPAARRLAGRG